MLQGTHRFPRQDQVVYGRPAAEVLKELAAAWGRRRLMITTTASLANGLAAQIAHDLGDLCVGVFSGTSAHSPREGVIAGAVLARRREANLLVAVGGGSAIDATKVMQLCLWADLHHVADLDPYRAGRGPDRVDVTAVAPGVRMAAVPTTLSAAEFTPFAGVSDAARHVKEGYAHPMLAPRAVVLDPAATLETPAELWLSTGMKAVDHAVEQLCNPVRTPYADALAEDGLRRLARGLPASKADPADLAAVERTLMAIRPYIRNFASAGALEALASGEICIALDYSGDVAQAAARAKEAGRGVEVRYVAPKEGVQVGFDMLAIPADAPHKDAALQFINFVLQPKVMADITNTVRYPNAVPASKALTDPALLSDPAVYPSAEVMKRVFSIGPVPLAAERARTRMWARFKAGG